MNRIVGLFLILVVVSSAFASTPKKQDAVKITGMEVVGQAKYGGRKG